MEQIGKTIMLIGAVIVLIGAVIWLAGDKLGWLGSLPGDIKVKKENFSFYAPITSMILLSILLSGLLWIIRKFLN